MGNYLQIADVHMSMSQSNKDALETKYLLYKVGLRTGDKNLGGQILSVAFLITYQNQRTLALMVSSAPLRRIMIQKFYMHVF